MKLSIWTLAAELCSTACIAKEVIAPLRTPVVQEVANRWPWMAMAGILLLLAVIALAARRRLPFGARL